MILRTANDIIVGADSKVNYAVATGNVETTCKIFQVGRVFVASAGMIESAEFEYDARTIATAAIQQGSRILEMMDRYQDAISQPLLEAAGSLHDQNPALYQSMIGDGEVLDTAFFGIENDVPALIYSQFEITFSPDRDVMKVVPGILGVDHYLLWGHPRPLKKFLDSHHGYFDEVGDVNAIRNLIQIAIDDKPGKVGKPIVIIRVNTEGAEWVIESPCCPPIEPY
ncbi:MAG: hypothetical protein AABO57_09730 [Acidobacteriota bacterium]